MKRTDYLTIAGLVIVVLINLLKKFIDIPDAVSMVGLLIGITAIFIGFVARAGDGSSGGYGGG